MVPRRPAARGGGASAEQRWRLSGAGNHKERGEPNSAECLLEWAQAFHSADHGRRTLPVRGAALSEHTGANYASVSLRAAGHS